MIGDGPGYEFFVFADAKHAFNLYIFSYEKMSFK